MKLSFTKMHGLGNDFIVIDAIDQQIDHLTSSDWRFLANRHLGIGADQILLVEKPSNPDADFKYRILNADGFEVEQCGNGSRCFVRFVRDRGLTDKTQIIVEVGARLITLTELPNLQVTVNMGAPILESESIPFLSGTLEKKMSGHAQLYFLPLASSPAVWVHPVSMGNPHAVQIVSDVKQAPVHLLGPLIENHPAFPKRVNAGFMEIVHAHHIRLRVFERGSGETLSCGTGACAAVVSGILQNLIQSPVQVTTRGGELTIAWDKVGGGQQAPVMMTGPASFVFEGHIEI
jgi:diaminopimelate epimerase